MRHKIGNQVGELTNLSGCSQIVISHDVFSLKKGSGEGVSSNKKRIEFCEELGYDVLICTVDLSNSRQLSILQKNGYKKVLVFTSSKTGHRVGIFCRHLNCGDMCE